MQVIVNSNLELVYILSFYTGRMILVVQIPCVSVMVGFVVSFQVYIAVFIASRIVAAKMPDLLVVPGFVNPLNVN